MFDATVIGGGPAGSAASLLLSRWGHRVALLSRNPKRQSLAESLPPSCANLFAKIGVRADIEAGDWVRATGNTVYWAGGPARVERFGQGQYGLQVDRRQFDAVILSSAVSAGAHAVTGTARRVTKAEASTSEDSDLWAIEYDEGGEPRTIHSRWVLDCTGRTGLMARQGLRRPEGGLRTTALVGVWERDHWDVPDATHTIVESYDGGWAWSVPVSQKTRYVTVMVDPSLTSLPSRQGLADAYRGELSRTAALSRLVHDASAVGEPWACDASPYTADRFAMPGLLLVGDAGSFIDPLSSFGVKKAFASAWLAAVVVHTCLENPAMEDLAVEFFEARERVMYDQLRRQTAELSREAGTGHSSDFWRERSTSDPGDANEVLNVDSLRTDPRVLAAFAELKRRPAVKLTLSPNVRVVQRATVQGNRLVLGDHLVAPGIAEGVRYVRNVDLMLLSRLAPQSDQVPDLFQAYNRAAPPAPLPDFLGALSVLVGLDVLALA
jgi:flavin-dependent dehydrogenase